MQLQDRVAIVTGAAQGVGAAAAHELSRQGARVVICDIEEKLVEQVAAEIRNDGGDAVALRVDVSKLPELDGLVKTAIERFGRLDILVNNAAVCPRIPMDDMTEAWFDRIIAINLKSVFFLSRAAGNAMKERQWGRIINVSSVGGRTGGMFASTVYSATKAGVMSMTKAFARHFAPYNITVTCVAPGSVDTRLMANLSPESLQATIDGVPLKRLADPLEVARVIAFLASEGSSYMTGAIVDVNGGALMP
ncbi:MAG: SDR family oxidoreductase [Chloroflexi bacterium]|nr:SDR family oxidoreductase [Chloroflexota bacterium]